MKKTKILYWIFTGLFAAFTALTSFSQLFSVKNSTEVMHILNLPTYLLPFLGTAKILGIVGILIPNLPRLKEWAYAGIMFDFIGASYCMIAAGGTIDKWAFMTFPILLCLLSYVYYHKYEKQKREIKTI